MEYFHIVFFDQRLLYVLTASYRIHERAPVYGLGCFQGNISVIQALLHIFYVCGAGLKVGGKDLCGRDDPGSLQLLLFFVQTVTVRSENVVPLYAGQK